MSYTFWVELNDGITATTEPVGKITMTNGVPFTDVSKSEPRHYSAICVEAMDDNDCRTFVAEEFGSHNPTIYSLPYPARPRFASSTAAKSECPSFCMRPATCKSHTSCPRSYSCTE